MHNSVHKDRIRFIIFFPKEASIFSLGREKTRKDWLIKIASKQAS